VLNARHCGAYCNNATANVLDVPVGWGTVVLE
jgi:hypothetical protein